MFPFRVELPEGFADNGTIRALPPTYDNPLSGATTDIRAQCHYSLSVVVERKGSKLALWKLPKKYVWQNPTFSHTLPRFPGESLTYVACDRLMVPFAYQPRMRPPQPVLSTPFPFLSTVKSLPEEWFQITSTMSPKSIFSYMDPIDCHVSPSQSVVPGRRLVA
jgi:hypothetical protein